MLSNELFTKETKYGCLLVSCFFLAWSLFFCVIGNLPFDRVTDDQARRVQHGMTKAEVIEILGEPDDITKDGWWMYWAWGNGSDPYWIGFDENDRLVFFQ